MLLPDRPSTPQPDNTAAATAKAAKQLLVDHADELTGLHRIDLLKAIERLAGDAYRSSINETDADRLAELERVVFESNMAGVEEGSDRFFELIAEKCRRMALTRKAVAEYLTSTFTAEASGFNEFDRILIAGAASISQAYDAYYIEYCKAVNHPAVVAALQSTDTTTVATRDATPYLLNPYTMIRVASEPAGTVTFYIEPFAIFFAAVLSPILAAFEETIRMLSEVSGLSEAQQAEITFMKQYRHAMSETNIEKLDESWNLVDRCWMKCKSNIQIVHDIEDGYSDPLRAKQGPDFSIRFLDETFASENATIKDIKGDICEFYEGRNSQLTKDGLTALSNTMAGIYYIPFKTGCSLVFSYSGQSIPNRLDVKKDLGVKIYFDAIETAARVEQVKIKVKSLFEDAETKVLAQHKPDAVEQLVWHVAAHEVGHAIYGMSNIENHVKKATVTMLEEPRAELTAMFTLRLLFNKGKIQLADLQKYLIHFALDAIRYFSKYDSQPLQPYIIFQTYAYNVYNKHGFISLSPASNKLTIDPSGTLAVLDEFSAKFIEVLDCLDANDAAAGKILDSMVETMRQPSTFTKDVIERCMGQ